MIEICLSDINTENLTRRFITKHPHSIGMLVLKQEVRKSGETGEDYTIGIVDVEFSEPTVTTTGVALIPPHELPFTPEHLDNINANGYISFGYYLAFQRD